MRVKKLNRFYADYGIVVLMSLPPIGYHCGTGVGSNGIGFSSFLSKLHGQFPSFSAAQIFAASPKSFAHCAWTPTTCNSVKLAVTELNIRLFIHAPYIINPCSWDDTAGADPSSSSAARRDEPVAQRATGDNSSGKRLVSLVINLLQAGARIAARGVVIHVGKSLKLGEAEGLRRMRGFFCAVLDAAKAGGVPCCRLLLETCAGQGTEVARDLGVFGAFVKDIVGVYGAEAFGCCVDTCHVFACGYKMTGLAALVGEKIGWSNVGVIHLNDSLTACCAHVDRHANIGEGKIGGEELAVFCKEAANALPGLPFVFETPESDDGSSRLSEMTWFVSLF